MAVAFSVLGVGRRLCLVGAVFDGAVDAGEVGECCRGEFLGEGVLGAGPCVVDGTGRVPVAGAVPQHAVVEGGGALCRFNHIQQGDLGWGARQG